MSTTIREVVQTDIKTIKPWLTDKENARWLDTFFQNKDLRDEQLAFFLMKREKKNYLVLYNDIPVGIVGFANIDEINKSAHLWVLLGDKAYRKKGIITVGQILALKKVFHELDLHSINIWITDGNISKKASQKFPFKPIGRQRECHLADGVFKDRIHFDMLRDDFEKEFTPETDEKVNHTLDV